MEENETPLLTYSSITATMNDGELSVNGLYASLAQSSLKSELDRELACRDAELSVEM